MEKYGYELWYDGNCITEDHGFDSEEEAIEEARSAIEDRMDLWISDGAAFDKEEQREMFDIRIVEAEEDNYGITLHFTKRITKILGNKIHLY